MALLFTAVKLPLLNLRETTSDGVIKQGLDPICPISFPQTGNYEIAVACVIMYKLALIWQYSTKFIELSDQVEAGHYLCQWHKYILSTFYGRALTHKMTSFQLAWSPN